MVKLTRKQKIAAEMQELQQEIGVVKEVEEEEPDDIWEATHPKCRYDEKLRLLKGLPCAPRNVVAYGGDDSAWIYWQQEDGQKQEDLERNKLFLDKYEVTGYIIRRFRLNFMTQNWDYKGSMKVPYIPGSVSGSAKVDLVSNGWHYSFTVSALSRRGLGLESPMTKPIKVDKPLPKLWKEIWDQKNKRSIYIHTITNQISLTRPETINCIVESSLYLKFRIEEHERLEAYFLKATNNYSFPFKVKHALKYIEKRATNIHLSITDKEVEDILKEKMNKTDATVELTYHDFLLLLDKIRYLATTKKLGLISELYYLCCTDEIEEDCNIQSENKDRDND